MDEPTTRFPLVLTLPIVWGDMDALGHVNNIFYFKQFESARMEYFRRTGVWDLFMGSHVGPILASTTCQFKHPVRYPNTVEVHTGVPEIRNTSFTMLYRTFCDNGRQLAAEGSGVIVMYDYDKNTKAPVSGEVRAAFEAFEKGTSQ